jgi:preprotein translocase subunit SecY
MASAAEQLASNFNFGMFRKATELKNRIWFTLGILIVYRFGTYIPLPGIDIDQLALLVETNQSGILGMFDVFAGGAISRMAIFALGIMPYISSSIIIQLMTSVSPTLANLKKEGEPGRKKNHSIYSLWNSNTGNLTGLWNFGRFRVCWTNCYRPRTIF